MYLHIVIMAFNKKMTTCLRTQIEQCLRNIPHECEGVERIELVDNQSRTSAGYTHALVSAFSSSHALDAYRTSTSHSQLIAKLEPHINEIVVLDGALKQDWRL
jgi:hypothetical protein